MEAEKIDLVTLTSARLEWSYPAYRVHFWSSDAAPGVADREAVGYSLDAWELTHVASVREVLAWAEQNAAGRSWTIYASISRAGEPGLVRLDGLDPTRSDALS